MALLLAAASSPSSSILRLAPRRWSRKLLAPLSNQRPIDSNTPGFCCAGAGGGAASCAQANGACIIRPATRHAAAIRRCRLSIMVQVLVQNTTHGDRPENARKRWRNYDSTPFASEQV